jgi:hypothetical protein
MSRVLSRSGCPGRAPATLKARRLIAPIAPVAARSAAAWSAARRYGRCFADWLLGLFAVHRAGRSEDQSPGAGAGESIEDGQGATDVGAPVVDRAGLGLAYLGQPG